MNSASHCARALEPILQYGEDCMVERDETSARNTAHRLRLLRKAEGEETALAWAARMGLSQSQLHNFVTGRRLTRDAAIRIATRVPGMTTDGFSWAAKVDWQSI